MKYSLFIIAFLITSISLAQRPSAKKNGKFFNQKGDKMLYGGNDQEHFIINNL